MVTRTSGTVTKALDILDLFLNHLDGLTVTQISTVTGINKSTVVRLCSTLKGRGYLQRDTHGVYFVGSQIDKLYRVFRSQFSLEDLVRPILVHLRDKTGESASFYVIDDDARVCLFRENSKHQIRHSVDEGTRFSLRKGVVGRVLHAYTGARGAAYATIRKQGYLDADGREPFTASVAAPVVSRGGNLIGALVVSGLSDRFDRNKRALALKLILESCDAVSDQYPRDVIKSA